MTEVDGEVCIKLDKSNGKTYHEMSQMFFAWLEQAKKLESGETSKEEYDDWRYNYPRIESERTKAALDILHAEKQQRKEEWNNE